MVGVEKDPRHRYATYTHENIGHYTNISKGGVESQVPVNESGKVSTYNNPPLLNIRLIESILYHE